MIEAVLIRNGHRKFHDNEIPRRVCAPSRRRYFIGRHICRRQRPAFERLIINNRPQQWLRVIKATGRILPLPSPPWKPRRKPSTLTAVTASAPMSKRTVVNPTGCSYAGHALIRSNHVANPTKDSGIRSVPFFPPSRVDLNDDRREKICHRTKNCVFYGIYSEKFFLDLYIFILG